MNFQVVCKIHNLTSIVNTMKDQITVLESHNVKQSVYMQASIKTMLFTFRVTKYFEDNIS